MFCHFVTFAEAPKIGVRQLHRFLGTIPLLHLARFHRPAKVRDRYYDDGTPPAMVIQLYFERLEALETAALPGGLLDRFTSSTGGSANVLHQAMWTRPLPVGCAPGAGPSRGCAYMVHYAGTPEAAPAWHGHYLSHHAPIMTRFPAVRATEVYTPVEWIDGLCWQRDRHFQRNMILFDNEADLKAALHSPVREEMRADRTRFPAFEGKSSHFAMTFETVVP